MLLSTIWCGTWKQQREPMAIPVPEAKSQLLVGITYVIERECSNLDLCNNQLASIDNLKFKLW